jgi:hypothetical protein
MTDNLESIKQNKLQIKSAISQLKDSLDALNSQEISDILQIKDFSFDMNTFM